MLAEEGESIEIAATNYGRHSNGANQKRRLTFSSLQEWRTSVMRVLTPFLSWLGRPLNPASKQGFQHEQTNALGRLVFRKGGLPLWRSAVLKGSFQVIDMTF